jgi:hypothetical protein
MSELLIEKMNIKKIELAARARLNYKKRRDEGRQIMIRVKEEDKKKPGRKKKEQTTPTKESPATAKKEPLPMGRKPKKIETVEAAPAYLLKLIKPTK